MRDSTVVKTLVFVGWGQDVGHVCNVTIRPSPQRCPSKALRHDAYPVTNCTCCIEHACHVTNVTYKCRLIRQNLRYKTVVPVPV